jgi:diguanylate cyclase (GGDEF)-like protein
MSLAHPSRDKSLPAYQNASDEAQLDALTHAAWHQRERNRARARSLAEQVLLSSNNDLIKSQALITQAYVFWREGHLAEALEDIQDALPLMRDHTPLTWLARALNVRNCIFLELGDFAQGTAGLEEQLLVSRAAADFEMEGCALHDLGVIHFERNVLQAEPFLQKALELFIKADSNEGQAYAHINLAHVYQAKAAIPEARRLHQNALEIANRNDLSHVITHILAQQGNLELNEGNLQAAQELFLLALKRTADMGERPLAEVMPSLVNCYRQLGKLNEAQVLLEGHLASMLREGLLPFAVQAHELLIDVLDEQGDSNGALKHSRDYIRLHRNVYTRDHENKVRALEVLHRTQLAEQRVTLEQQRNKELRHSLEQLEHLNQQSTEASLTDELTGLRNRRYLMRHVALTLRETPFSLAILDLDYFKKINDTYGHDGGDAVLKEFAALLAAQVREHDIPIRFGGEEFIVLFPNTGLEQAKVVLTRIRAKMQHHVWSALKTSERVTFTAGLTKCSDGDLQHAIQGADVLLYVGKGHGRDGIWSQQE